MEQPMPIPPTPSIGPDTRLTRYVAFTHDTEPTAVAAADRPRHISPASIDLRGVAYHHNRGMPPHLEH